MDYIPFSKDFNGIKKGDILINVDGIGFFTKGKEYIALGDSYENGGDCFVRVHNDNGTWCNRYVHRFAPKNGAVKNKEKAVAVACIDDKNTRLILNRAYFVQERKNGKVKLTNIPQWFSEKRFHFVEGIAAPVLPKLNTIDKDLQELKDKVDKGRAGTCSYAVKYKNYKTRYQIADVCHARIFTSYYAEEKGKEIEAIYLNVSGHYNKHVDKEAYKEYVKYITQESPWAKAFIPRDIDMIIKDGVAMDVTQPHNFVASAAVALRVGSEYDTVPSLFKKFIDTGSPANAAWLTAAIVQDERLPNVDINSRHGGHHVIYYKHSFEGLKEFFNKGKCFNKGVPVNTLHKDNQHYKILAAIAQENPKDSGTLENFLGSSHKGAAKVVGRWGGETVKITKHPVFGWMSLLCTIAREIV